MSYSGAKATRSNSVYAQRRIAFGNRRNQSRPERSPFAFQPGQRLQLAPIFDPENLIRTWDVLASDGGDAPGIDGICYSHLGPRERADLMRALAKAVKAGEYRPQPSQHVQLPKPDGGTRTLSLRTVMDRTLSSAVTKGITPVIDPTFLPLSKGFRPARNIQQLLAEMNAAVVRSGFSWIVNADIRKAFDYVPVQQTLAAFQRHVNDNELLRLIETILRGHDGEARCVGIDQGDPLSPLALNVLLDSCLDRPLVAACPSIPYWRYADNLVCTCQCVSDGQRVLSTIRQTLTPLGMSVKDNPTPVNLHRQGAHTELLGIDVSLGSDGHLRLRIPTSAWHALHTQLGEGYLTANVVHHARSVVDGWCQYYGMAIGNEECSDVAVRVLRELCGYGIREACTEEDVRKVLVRARNQWISVRDRSIR